MARLIGNRQKAIIHVAKAKLGLTDEDYLACLSRVGVKTSKSLTWIKYKELMAHFNSLGFHVTIKNKRKYIPKNTPQDKAPLMRKLYALLHDLDKPLEYADAMSSRMFSIDKAAWLKTQELYKLVQALSVYQKNKKGKKYGKNNHR